MITNYWSKSFLSQYLWHIYNFWYVKIFLCKWNITEKNGKKFSTKVIKIFEVFNGEGRGRGVKRVNWDKVYGPSDTYSNTCTWNKVGETLVTKILLHGIFKWFEKNVAAQRISPRTRTILSKVRFQQVQTVTYNYLSVTICIHCISYYICTNLQHFISVNLQWESILKLNSVLMTYCKKLSECLYTKFSKVRDKLEQHINSCAFKKKDYKKKDECTVCKELGYMWTWTQHMYRSGSCLEGNGTGSTLLGAVEINSENTWLIELKFKWNKVKFIQVIMDPVTLPRQMNIRWCCLELCNGTRESGPNVPGCTRQCLQYMPLLGVKMYWVRNIIGV